MKGMGFDRLEKNVRRLEKKLSLATSPASSVLEEIQKEALAGGPGGKRRKRRRPRRFLPFGEARAFVHSLGLRSKAEWAAYSTGKLARSKGKRPDNIPGDPARYYSKRWAGWGDWLGTRNIAPKDRRYLAFTEARAFAQELGLKSAAEWLQWSRGDMPEKGRRPMNIPSAPWQVYRDSGWKSMGDWLGTGEVCTRKRTYRTFSEARAMARSLGLTTRTEWYRYCCGKFPRLGRKPMDIPSNPDAIYEGKGWQGWSDFIGAKVHSNPGHFRPYEEASRYAKTLGVFTCEQWHEYFRDPKNLENKPDDIPLSPNYAYKKAGWTSWGDFLGALRPRERNGNWRPYAEARAWVRGLELRSELAWRKWIRRPENLEILPRDIPLAPAYAYRESGWVSLISLFF